MLTQIPERQRSAAPSLRSRVTSSPDGVSGAKRYLHILRAEMAKWAAYLVTVGTEPGVYDEWPECAARVIKVEGSIYKGYRTKGEALDAYRAALAEGRVKVVRSDATAPPRGVPAGAQVPPSRNPSSPSSPSTPSAHTRRPAARASPRQPPSTRPPSRQPSAHAAPIIRTPPNAAPLSSVQSPGPAPVSRSSSSPNVLCYEHVPSPRRRVQSTAQSPAGHTARSPAAAPRSLPTSPPARTPPSRSARTPASLRPQVAAVAPPSPMPSGVPAGDDTDTASSTNSSPRTGVTYIEPDLSSLDIGGSPRASPQASTRASPRASPHSASRSEMRSPLSVISRMRAGIQFAEAQAQAGPPQPERVVIPRSGRPSSSILSSPARTVSSGTRGAISRSRSEGVADMRYLLLGSQTSLHSPSPSSSSPAPSVPATQRSARAAGAVMSARASPASAALSPLALGLSQPLHTPGIVYPASADPRSPIRRSTAVPSRSPVFHRPSPPSVSLTSVLFGG
ncbi:hypothetical protein DAEQUDRAFT_63234 [Daedalea quercina L-15889]|uniref:Ribonuclease H1 N-terminal domain-containing protein n=1 Tax=Daedalea quercina L-15889 TaxID=1314783 RepID=A0A165SMQ0_9APHY|nr:hypothetical protein DAEQUDRAFT_63234 [Daedalea quercina L-15889]